MRPREDALKALRVVGIALASTSALAALSGCGAIFNSSQHVEIVTKPEDKAVAYAGGAELAPTAPGKFTTPIFLNVPVNGTPVVIAPGKRIAPVELERHASAGAIVGDILWSLTIIGVAAPISDAALGTFSKTGSPVDVQLVPDSPDANPMPTYAVAGASIPAVDEPVAIAAPAKTSASGAAAPAPPPEPPAPPPPPPPPPKKRR